MTSQKFISLRGAREHNLKNIDIDIPRNKIVIITGLSGSGKSSLAFDTIYAEGQRRYVESLSAYARQFLEMMQKPDYDRLDGLSPAISIEQKTTSKNPRSTVGTITEIYDYMRLLFARVGVPYSPVTGLPIASQTVSQMVDRLIKLEENTRLYILSPLAQGRKGEYKKEIAELEKQGFQRIKLDGEFYEIEQLPDIDKKYKHYIDVVVDRVAIKPSLAPRLADSLETCLKLSGGLAIAELADKPIAQSNAAQKNKNETHQRIIFSEKFACPVSGFTISEIEPRIFSFNNPYGACPKCSGLGFTKTIDVELVVPDAAVAINMGAFAPLRNMQFDYYDKIMAKIANFYKFKRNARWQDIPKEAQQLFLYAHSASAAQLGAQPISAELKQDLRSYKGLIPNMLRRWSETSSSVIRDDIEKYMTSLPCEACGGYRLKPESLAIKIANQHIGQLSEMAIGKALDWFAELPTQLSEKENAIATPILKEIQERLTFLNNVGLSYLTISRSSGTLSGGESQRIRLASQIGSGLTGVLYILDEPSIGLHQRDNFKLLETLRNLRDLGNSVIIVEHDEDAMLASDYIIDMGPAAGIHGGQIVAKGTPAEIMQDTSSLTGQYLSGKLSIKVPQKRRTINKDKVLQITGARGNNLKNITATIPLGLFTCITGVSGSGKSTLLIQTLFKAASKAIMGARTQPAPYDKLTGLEHIDKVIDIDQAPIGRTPRSNPATYIGVFTYIRDWFAGLPAAKAKGYGAGRFSFNVKGGRCEACQGDGVVKIEMHFLPDLYVVCDVCNGKRYNRETLQVVYKDKSIADILDMTIEEGVEFFIRVPSIHNKLIMLEKVGLGYVKIGQQATTLSGGEAQRVKLAKELSRRATGNTLYILDEPTTGLHFHDIAKLLDILQDLVDKGNSVVIIEHNLEVIKTADWVIDFGPEGGDEGGIIITEGQPEDIIKVPASYTGKFLKNTLERKGST